MFKNFPLVDGKCIKPKLIKGCESYNIDEKCTSCVQGYTLQNGNCVFKECTTSQKKTEYCGICDAGFYLDYDGICVGYDGTKDTNTGVDTDEAKGNKIEYALLIALVAFLI